MAEDPADTMSEASVPQDHLDHPSSQPDTTTANKTAEDLTNTTSESDVLPNHPDHVPSQQDIPLTQSSRTPDRVNTVASQRDLSDTLVAPTTSLSPKVNLGVPPPILDIANPSILPVTKSQWATLHQSCPQAGVRFLDPPPGKGAAAQSNGSPPSKLLAGVTDRPMWMKKKKILDYFCSTFKLGNLSDIIEHWYELEGLLGFPETVSVSV